jgi:hypothetical protein
MEDQPKLFYGSSQEVITSAILAAGGFKTVAGKLWPSRKPESAYARLKACVDDDKPETLCLDEVILIAKMAREAGDHSLMRFLGMELSYEIKPIAPEDEKTALQRSFVQAVKTVERIAERLEKFGGLRAVS